MNIFDVLREKLDENSQTIEPLYNMPVNVIGLNVAIEIVNQVEQEYNDGWISCSDRLPTEYANYNVSCRDEKGKEWVTTMMFDYGKFGGVSSFHNLVVAWQPLPEPYKEYSTPRKQTNADRIRSMSDEELAELLPIVSDYMCKPTIFCLEQMEKRGECVNTKKCALNWLNEEVSND